MRELQLHILKKHLLRAAVTLVVMSLFLLGCEHDNGDDIVLVAATPASVQIGETVTVELRSLEPVFTGKKVTPVASDGDMIMGDLSVLDNKNAIATLYTSRLTGPGVHTFELDFGDTIALLEISAVNPPKGPGTVTADLTEATAGAHMATMTISGHGTQFDGDVTAEVIGAPGMSITSVYSVTDSKLEIRFSIALDQAPALANVQINDGPFQYEVPLNIVPATVLQSSFTTQTLVKGRAGTIEIGTTNANFRTDFSYKNSYTEFEFGNPTVIEDNRISVPARVAFDSPEDVLEFEYYTYDNRGASLQIMQVSVPLHKPSYIAVSPSSFSRDEVSQKVSVIGKNVDFTKVNEVLLDADEYVTMTNWSVVNTAQINMELLVSSTAAEKYYPVSISDDAQTLYGGMTLNAFPGGEISIDEGEHNVVAGDHLYVNVTFLNIVLDEAVTAVGDENVEVVGLTRIDQGCIILELSISPDAPVNQAMLPSVVTVHSGGDALFAYFKIVEAGV